MKVAIVHDWLTGMRGGEAVLEALLRLHPDAELFTLLHVPGAVSDLIEDRPIHTSFLQHVPGVAERYRYLLPLFPRAIESLEIRGFDLVISSSHCVAKGARIEDGAPHLCYCHTPMRYAWDQFDAYFGAGRSSRPVAVAMSALAPRLRAWDVRTASGVDRFVANSRHVADRIRRFLGRGSTVVHPPVAVERFTPGTEREDYYVVLGASAPYKRVDLAIEACERLGRRLRIVGGSVGRGAGGCPAAGGESTGLLRTGRVSGAEVARILGRARALLLPGVEDFGIGVVEALASGTPVIAQGRGGVLDSVRPLGGPTSDGPPTGVFFDDPTPESLMEAILRFEDATFDTTAIVSSAARFSFARFASEMRQVEVELLASRHPRERSRRP